MLPATRATCSNREKQRERERTARQRRAAHLESMRVTYRSLQTAVLAIHTLDEQVWERFLNADALRMRNFLKESLRLETEESVLRHEHDTLNRQLTAHRQSTRVLAQLLHDGQEVDHWRWKLERLRTLQRQNYKPWTMQDCQEEIDKALKTMSTFEYSPDKQTSGASVLGWRETRCIDLTREVLQFQFHKMFHGYDIMDYVNTAWDAYTDNSTYQQIILGPRIIGTLETMQQLGPNTIIVRIADRIPSLQADIHIVFLVYRMRTQTGFIQLVRTLRCPELMKAIELEWPHDRWPSNFIWFQWKLLDDDETGYTLRVGGALGYSGISYANLWMWEAFGSVLRSEQAATRRSFIRNE